MTTAARRFLSTLWHGYRFTAVTLLNALVALLLVNVTLAAIFMITDHSSRNRVLTRYGDSVLNAAYQGQGSADIAALLDETWSRPFVYEPFTQFKERPFRGAYVNVDSHGFRLTKNQGPWPPQPDSLNIFLFGGSTTFGYGVADDHTIASYLQEYLTVKLDRTVRVYNFGRGHYYSTQERILYEALLAAGLVPHIAVFIDGLNDFYYHSDEPEFTSTFREVVATGAGAHFISTTSLGRAVRMLKDRLSTWRREQPRGQLGGNAEDDIHRRAALGVIDPVIKRYLSNKTLIEAASKPFAVQPVFLWQPVPTYHYDQRYHPFAEGGFGRHSYSQYGYERMAEYIEATPLGDNFLWGADIQEAEKQPLYVDKTHYSAGFSKRIAMVVGDVLIERFAVDRLK
jgi:hypothetical protein